MYIKKESKLLAEKTLKIMSSGPTCNENYNSNTGKPFGVPEFGWSMLALDLLSDLAT